MTTILPQRDDNSSSPSPEWLLDLSLALVADEATETDAVAHLVAEAGGNFRLLEGAYGRALVLRAERPEDPAVATSLVVLVKALRQVPHPASRPG